MPSVFNTLAGLYFRRHFFMVSRKKDTVTEDLYGYPKDTINENCPYAKERSYKILAYYDSETQYWNIVREVAEFIKRNRSLSGVLKKHDKDNARNHVHILIKGKNAWSRKKILQFCREELKTPYCPIELTADRGTMRDAVRYLLHWDSKDKYQYSEKDLVTFGNFNAMQYLHGDKKEVRRRKMLEIEQVIMEDNIQDYKTLHAVIKSKYPEDYSLLGDTTFQYTISNYMNLNRQTKPSTNEQLLAKLNSDLNDEKADLKSENTTLRAKNEELQKKIADLAGKYADLVKKNNEKPAETKSELKAEIEQLHQRLDDKDDLVKELSESNKRHTAEKSELKSEIAKLKNKVAELKSEKVKNQDAVESRKSVSKRISDTTVRLSKSDNKTSEKGQDKPEENGGGDTIDISDDDLPF